MMKTAKRGLLVATILAGALAATPGEAATFLFTFSGASLGNSAKAIGSFDITDSALATVNAGGLPSYGSLSNLTLTVTGAGTAAGNGVFTNTSFSTFLFRSPAALDFTRQLVGQSVGNGATFGQSIVGGDFNFFGNGVHTPSGYSPFTLGADTGLGSKMVLTSLMAVTAIPEPASWAMMILGIGAVGFAMRRYRRRSVRVFYSA